MNEDLAEAIALGHDLGHTPFGHAGEQALNEICPFGFAHFEQSVRVVELLEKNGKGLNLTWEVRDGSEITERPVILPRWKERSYGFQIKSHTSITILMMHCVPGF